MGLAQYAIVAHELHLSAPGLDQSGFDQPAEQAALECRQLAAPMFQTNPLLFVPGRNLGKRPLAGDRAKVSLS